MILSDIAIRILNQLQGLVLVIQERDFTRSSATLSGSTIGQHIRHILEFFLCFEAGYMQGVVNYDKRPHDKTMETDRDLALSSIARIIGFVSRLEEHKNIILEVRYDPLSDEYVSVQTNTLRELVYNIEHAVHHMAIIKIGIMEMAPYVSLDGDFGVAASTIRFHIAETEVSRTLS